MTVAGERLRYGRVHALEVRGERLGEHQAFFYEPREGLDDFYDASGRAVHGGWLRTPLRRQDVVAIVSLLVANGLYLLAAMAAP